MTVKEMHIEVSQSTQNIAANTRRKLLSEEIDWLLNKNQQRFIQSKVKPRRDGSGGFEVDQVDTDAIRTMLKTTQLSAEIVEGGYQAYLPSDYAYLINDNSRTLKCGALLTQVNTLVDLLFLPLPVTGKPAAPFYEEVSVTVGPTTFTLAEISAANHGSYLGVRSKSEVFVIQDVLLHYMRQHLGLDVYWERYKTVYKPHTFIIPGFNAGSITVDGAVTAATTATDTRLVTQQTTGTWVANRLTASNKVMDLLQVPYYRSSHLSPISELLGNYLKVYGDTGFIVTKVGCTYVRKPRRISLVLGLDCELAEEFHQAVCDLTVEYAKAMMTDPSWEVKLRDNMARSLPNQ